MLSLCMIVKNEEENLDKCLKQVYSFVDQIVIIDTGSTDGTKVIALKYTTDVYDFVWCNDFSKARNFSLGKANYDWVLILDADEVVTDFDKIKVEDQIFENPNKVGRLKRINLFEDGDLKKKYIERVNRLFNKNEFHYEGSIHEQIVKNDGHEYTTFLVDIIANHIGYTKEVINNTQKLKRNIEMLNEALLKNPNDPYLNYQLGKSFFMEKNYHKAFDCFSSAIKLGVNPQYEYSKDLIESYGYSLIKCEKYNEALDLISYNIYYGNSPDFNFMLGLIYMNNAQFDNALDHFKKCIGPKEGNVEGINSYQPNYNIGVIYEVLGDLHQALNYYHIAGDYPLAVKRRKILETQLAESYDNEIEMLQDDFAQGAIDFAKIRINNLMNIKESRQLKIYLGIADIIKRDFLNGINILSDVFSEVPTDYDIAYNIALGYVELEQNDLALYWLNIIRENSTDIDLLADTESLFIKLNVFNESNA